MTFTQLSEMVSWMRQEGVLHLSHEGTVITLAESNHVIYSPGELNQAKDESAAETSPEEDEFELPQARIYAKRAQLRESHAEVDSKDR